MTSNSPDVALFKAVKHYNFLQDCEIEASRRLCVFYCTRSLFRKSFAGDISYSRFHDVIEASQRQVHCRITRGELAYVVPLHRRDTLAHKQACAHQWLTCCRAFAER